jgi:hypothetical protein
VTGAVLVVIAMLVVMPVAIFLLGAGLALLLGQTFSTSITENGDPPAT